MNISTTRSGNRLTIRFTRPLISPDTSGRDENLNVCRNVLWVFGGSTTFVNGTVTALRGHSNQGIFANQLCLCTTTPSASPTPIVISTEILTPTPSETPTATPTATPGTCDGQFTATQGSYVFSWSLQSNGMYVDCNVSVNTGANTWVAVGFSENRMMVNIISNFMCWVF